MLVLVTANVNKVNAQAICMVTADYQDAESYLVIWVEFTDVSNIDSIYIYRQKGIETVFTKIGAVDVTLTSPTYFIDNSANTRDTTKYAISYLNASGVETARSAWHQAVVMDYNEVTGMGYLTWTKYKKEDQTDESYIFSYECKMDETGLGMQQSMAVMMNNEFAWTDQSADLHPNASYELLVSLPDCNVMTKANINTSRSNIKNQQSNAYIEDHLSLSVLSGTKFTLAPNPTVDNLTVTMEESIKGKAWISNAKGENIVGILIDGKSVSFDTTLLSSGVYFLSIESKGVVTSKKFIKK